MNKVKVCHIVCGLQGGGVETMIYNYCSNIKNKEYEWHMLYQHEPSQKNIEEFNSIGFKLKKISSKKQHPFANYYQTYKYLKDKKIDVVHCHMTIMNFIPLIAATQARIKVRICHSHETNKYRDGFLQNLFLAFSKKMCYTFSTIRVACGQEAGKFLYGNKKFSIINNAINLDNFEYNSTKRRKIRNLYNFDDSDIVIGHIGRFIEAKNHEFIIDIFKGLIMYNKKYKLILVGNGELEEKIKDKVKKYNLEDSIIFTGIIKNANEYYSAFDLFILPSIREGLPLVLLEAQVSGVKCMLSESIDSNSIIVEKKCKVLPLNEKEWIDAIKSENYNYTREKRLIILMIRDLI